jgi:hypothetical protein
VDSEVLVGEPAMAIYPSSITNWNPPVQRRGDRQGCERQDSGQHPAGVIVDVTSTGEGLGGLLAEGIDAYDWNIESAVSAVLLTPYEVAYAVNVHFPRNPLERELSLAQHVSLGDDIAWDRFEMLTHYPGASVRDEGKVVNWLPSIFTPLRAGGRIYVVKVTYGPKSGGPTPGVVPNGKEDYAP